MHRVGVVEDLPATSARVPRPCEKAEQQDRNKDQRAHGWRESFHTRQLRKTSVTGVSKGPIPGKPLKVAQASRPCASTSEARPYFFAEATRSVRSRRSRHGSACATGPVVEKSNSMSV